MAAGAISKPQRRRSRSTNVCTKAVSPSEAVLVGIGEERRREAAAQPQPVTAGSADLGQAETRHGDHLDPACEGLGSAPHDFRRCAAQEQELGWKRLPVQEHAQQGQKIHPQLDLVQDDETLRAFQHQLGSLQTSHIGRILKIEILALLTAGDAARHGGLARLTGTQ